MGIVKYCQIWDDFLAGIGGFLIKINEYWRDNWQQQHVHIVVPMRDMTGPNAETK